MSRGAAKACGLGLFFGLVACFWLPGFSQGPKREQQTSERESLASGIPLQVIVVQSAEDAESILERLKRGEDFAELARERSIDPTAEQGGYMGEFEPSALRSELRDAIAGLRSGQVSRVVRIPSGYAILKVMTKDTARKKEADAARSFALSAVGAVKYVLDVDGLGEAETALLRFPKAPDWNSDPRNVCELRKQSLSHVIEVLTDLLSDEHREEIAREPAIDVMQAEFALAQLHAYRGDMDSAIERYQAAYRIAAASVPAAIPQMEEALGIIYLHKSEMENDAYRAPGQKCLLPMPLGICYAKTSDSQKAVEYFLKYLERKPDELEVRWLLNLAYMTLGKYPRGVPQQFLIPPSAFQSKEDAGRFVDVAVETGLKSFSTAGGVIVDDFENNGLLDVVTSGFESCSPMHYFHNNGDGTFTDNTAKAGLGDQVGGLNIIQTDYNNDGCIDILVLRGGWEFPQRKSLLRNNCDGTFTDVTTAAGLAEPTSSQAAVWTDINNDGLLDLFVGNERGVAQLFLNKGDGTFEDIAVHAGVSGDGTAFSKGVAAADYDNDGWVDLYVSNLNGQNFLYHNNHDNTFTEVAGQAHVPGSGRGFATWFFDYDNDGYPDLFVTSYFTSVDDTVRTFLGLPHNAATLKLYKNLGHGDFRDVTSETGLDKVFMPMGANFGDIDNDGFLDIFMGTGNPSYASLVRSVLLRNHDGKYFADVTSSSGTGELHKGHGVAFADLANNGEEDIVFEVGGATPGDRHMLRVFKNPGNGNDWITVKLVGVKSNRVGIDARIKVTVENEGSRPRAIYRTVGSGGSFGASPLQQHIGLGKSARITSLEVYWPVSKTRQIFHDVEKNQFIEIREFAGEYTKSDRRPFRLRGPGERFVASSRAKSKGVAPSATSEN